MSARHRWEWFGPDLQMCIKEGCLLEREMKTPTADAYPTGRYRRLSKHWYESSTLPKCRGTAPVVVTERDPKFYRPSHRPSPKER